MQIELQRLRKCRTVLVIVLLILWNVGIAWMVELGIEVVQRDLPLIPLAAYARSIPLLAPHPMPCSMPATGDIRLTAARYYPPWPLHPRAQASSRQPAADRQGHSEQGTDGFPEFRSRRTPLIQTSSFSRRWL